MTKTDYWQRIVELSPNAPVQLPIMTSAERDDLPIPVPLGSFIYNSTTDQVEEYTTSGWIGRTSVQYVKTIDELEAMTVRPKIVFVESAESANDGIFEANDGGGHWYYWVPNLTTPANGTTIVNPTGTPLGRYRSSTMIPGRLTGVERDAIHFPAEGMLIYNLDTKFYEYFNGTDWLTTSADPGSGFVPTSRQVATAPRLTGGGDLSANRTIDLAQINPSGAGPKPIVDIYGRVTAFSTLDAGDISTGLGYTPVPPTRLINTAVGRLTGGGDLSSNRTIDLATVTVTGSGPKPTVDAYGRVTALSQLAGSDITNSLGYTPASNTRQIATAARLTGGGDLSADRTIDLAQVNPTGSGPKPTVDVYGRVTSLSALASADITGPLGYTPANAATGVYSVATLADLKALTTRPPLVIMSAKDTPGDDQGGIFVWTAGSSATPDDQFVVQCTSGPSGRYIHLVLSVIPSGHSLSKIHTSTNGMFVNSDSVSEDVVIEAGTNAISAGPVTVEDGVTVTVSPGQRWVIV